jgi:RNA polymerase sigma-70 factor (ECF subfamily)
MAEEAGGKRSAAGTAGATGAWEESMVFARYRPLLFSVAYRMMGSALDAEDLVQDSFVRWQGADRAAVSDPKAYLTTVVTRLAIDHLRAARVRREEYAGPWLPEPIATDGVADMAAGELADSLSLAFLTLLERLTPVERAVFLLHDVFAYPFDEVARVVGKAEANCRQIAGRARRRVREGRPRFAPSPAEHEDLTRRFVRACTDGDLDGLLALLTDDVIAWADGGGKAPAARRPIQGATNVARYLLGVVAKAPADLVWRVSAINGQPGLVVEAGRDIVAVVAVVALEVTDGRVAAIRSVVNPDKLRGLAIRRP